MKRRMGPAIVVPLAVVAMALFSAACDVAFQGLNATARDEWKKTYTLAPGGHFQVTNVNGAIEVSPSDGRTVEVVAERRVRASSEQAAKEALKSLQITEKVSPDDIRLEVPGQSGGMHFGSREVSFKIKLPADAVVRLTTRNGGVSVEGLKGPVKVETSNGAINGENIGGSLDAGTTNGGITVQMTALGPDGVRLDTTNGGITLRVPVDTRANISARWVHGGFEATGLKPEGESDRRHYDGKLNGGGPRIDLSTTNGGIRISS